MSAPETPKARPLSLSLIRAQLCDDTLAAGLIIFDADTDLADLALDLAQLMAEQVRAAELVNQLVRKP